MIIYNVLFKGVEINKSSQNFCKAFTNLESAENFAETAAAQLGLTIKSGSGWLLDGGSTEIGNLTDFRCEDSSGNSYYFVIYVQEI